MDLPFLDRRDELARLTKAFDARARLVVLYGRRRLGKSRLLVEALGERPGTYWIADQRAASLQLASLAREIGRRLPRFDAVTYPDWEVLLDRFYESAAPGFVLVLDEFPELVRVSPELPSLLQKYIDRSPPGVTLALCGSSQTMMHGLVLDGAAPLYGRATELMRLEPLTPRWLDAAFPGLTAAERVERWAVFGGVPRYWELSKDQDLWGAARALVLDPLGPLHREPERLLRDDVSELARAESILALIGQGGHRISEIAARMGVHGNDLSRPMARLVMLGLVSREVPFGRTLRDTKRTRYGIADPFLRFWYRFVEPNRSLLEARQVQRVLKDVRAQWRPFLGHAWEDLARASVVALSQGAQYGVARRFWGPGARGPIELDIVAEIESRANAPRRLLVGEAKLTVRPAEVPRLLAELRAKAASCPELGLDGDEGRVDARLFVLDFPEGPLDGADIIGPEMVLRALG